MVKSAGGGMNKIIKLVGVSLFILTFSKQVAAAFILNGTRYIYEEGKNNISFEVTNQTDETFGGQVWIDNSNKNNSAIYMVPAPPFFKIHPKEKQIIRIIKTDDSLPSDRESLFWLNVQEIPPKLKNSEANAFAVAINTRVKLIYRPRKLQEKRRDSERKIQIVYHNDKVYLKNPTPYYFAVSGITLNGHLIKLSDEVLNAIAILAPESEVKLGQMMLNGVVGIQAVNDAGSIQTYTLN